MVMCQTHDLAVEQDRQCVPSAGVLNLAFRQREDGTKLDQVLLTNDLSLVPGTGNQAPSVNAGPDQTVTLPNSAF